MKRNLICGIAALVVLAVCLIFSNLSIKKTDSNKVLSLEEKRDLHQSHLDNSPFKESLEWDKSQRKLKGLPPDKYYEQMWELTMDPTTGRLNDGNITILREQLALTRASERNPGELTNAWEERGPNNVGGRSRVVFFDPNDSSNNTVFAGGVSGGLWKNTNISNSNSTWTRVQNVPGNLAVTSLTVDPNNSNIWYLGTGEQYTAGDVVGNGVYKSTDGGNSWSSVNIPSAAAGDINFNSANLFLDGIFYVNDIIAWNNNGNTELFVGVGAHVYGDSSSPTNWLGLQTAGLYRSTNGGSSWSRIETANMQYSFSGSTYYIIPNDFEISANNTLWMGSISTPGIGGAGGKVFSTNNGSNWTEAPASPLTDSNRVELEASASNPNKIYALTQGVSNPVHIYLTTNAFGSISETSLPNDADTNIAANDFCRGQAFYDLVIEADPFNDNVVYVGGINLFKSTNSGSSWGQLSHWYGGFGYQYVHADQHAIAFGNNSSSQVLIGNDGGIYYSGNAGGVISARNNGYNVTQFVKAGIGPDGNGDTNGIFSAGAQDNGTQAFRDGNTSPGINSSEELSDGDGFYTFVDKDGDYMIATYVNNVIYRFNLPWNGQGRIDGGATTLSSSQTTGDFVNQMGYDDDANRLLSNNTSGSSVSIRSINVGTTSSGILSNSALSSKPTAFRASPFQANTWYVGTANGGLLRLTNVTNSSASWSTISTPFLGSVSSVRFGETANDIIVTIHNYGVTSVWSTSDGGANWDNKEGDLPDIPVRDFLLNPLNTNEAILATQLGVWSTSNFNDSNPSWSQAYNGMSDVSVTAFDYWDVSGDNTNNKVIASTYGRGVFTGKFTDTAEPDTEAPTAPSNLIASNTTQSGTTLDWSPSTDNVAVAEYGIRQDGNEIAVVNGQTNTYNVTGLTPNTTYDFTVVARDASSNESSSSNTETVTTEAPDTTPPTAPSSLVASNITDTSVNLAWSPSTDNVGVVSYKVFSNTVEIGTTAGTNVTVNGLTANTQYTFFVVALDAENNASDSSNEVTVTTEDTPIVYCASQSSNVNDEYISNVQLNTINNNSGAQFYSDFTAISTVLTKGTQYTVSVTPTWTGTLYNEGYAVWIDFNRDGDFTDANELIFSQSPTQATPVSGSFTVPETASEVSTTMRVSMSYNAIPTPCQQFTYGEVEDYTVVIEGSGPDTEAPIITLNGPSTINLELGESYTEFGATATDNIDGDLTGAIQISGSVNSGVVGTYNLTYSVSDAAGNQAQTSRTVNVLPDTTKPVISLNGPASISLNLGEAYVELGATATDNFDGDITSAIQVTGSVNTTVAGTYNIAYNVSDSSGNVADEVIRTVEVLEDTVAPVITLNGVSPVTVQVGDSYTDAGATAVDNIDGDITANIVVTGSVNTSIAGTYILEYNVSDSAGNAAATVNRVVNVESPSTGPVVLHEGYFETGWDNWIDGGSDCARYSGARSSEGSFSIRLRDNSGVASSMTSEVFDLSSYSTVDVKFEFYVYSMENNEDFWLRYFDGSSWITVATYARGVNINNNTFYTATVTLDSNAYNFAPNAQFRFQCDASGNADQIYIDAVVITADANNSTSVKGPLIETGTLDEGDSFAFEGDFSVYPQPAKTSVTVSMGIDVEDKPDDVTVTIFDLSGKVVKTKSWTQLTNPIFENKIDVSNLNSGVYILSVESSNGSKEFKKLIVD